MAREAVVRRHSFAQQVIRFYICAFLLSASKRGGWGERDKVGSDTQCANPNVLSKISDREKKEGRREGEREEKEKERPVEFDSNMVET